MDQQPPQTNIPTNPPQNIKANKKYPFKILLIIIFFSVIFLFAGYKFGSNNTKVIVRKVVMPNTIPSLTPTPSPLLINIVSIKESKQYKLIAINIGINPSCIFELHLVETNTLYGDPNDRVLGHPFCNGIKNNFAFSPDGSIVVLVNYDNNVASIENGSISMYSIPENKIINKMPFNKIFQDLTFSDNKTLYYLNISPDNNKIAVSYGFSLRPDYSSQIIIIDIKNDEVKLLNQKGLVSQWKNNNILEIETLPKEYKYENVQN